MDAKEHILNTAEWLFAKSGYHVTTIRDIANEAKVNSSMVNYYFDSKENLYATIFEKFKREIQVVCSIHTEISDFDKAYKSFLYNSIQLFNSHTCSLKLFFSEQIQASSSKIAIIIKEIENIHFQCYLYLTKSFNIPIKRKLNFKIEWFYYETFSIFKDLFRLHYQKNEEYVQISLNEIQEIVEMCYQKLSNDAGK